MNQKIIWDHIKNKTIESLQGFAFDVSPLCEEFVEQVITPRGLKYNKMALADCMAEAVAYATTLESKLSQYQIAPLRADQFELILNSALKEDHHYYCLNATLATELYEQLKQHRPDFDRFGLSKSSMVINHTNASRLFELLKFTIDPDSKHYSAAQQLFNNLRRKLSPEEHLRYFECSLESQGPFRLKNPETMLTSFIEAAFHINKSHNPILSHNQLWTLAQHITPEEQIELFGQPILNRTQDIPTAFLDFQLFFRLAKRYGVEFDLEDYQYHRLVGKLSLSQSSYLGEMTLAKAAGFSENTLQSGSQYIGAYGFEASKFMKIFGALLGTAINCSTLIQRATMPILGSLGLLSAKWHHDAQVELEAQQRRATVLSFLNANTTATRIQRKHTQMTRLRDRVPHDKTHYLHNQLSHYRVLRNWVVAMRNDAPSRVRRLLQEQAETEDHKTEAELLSKLTRALLTTPEDTYRDYPLLNAYLDLVRQRVPSIVPAFTHHQAKSVYNPEHKQKWFPRLALLVTYLGEQLSRVYDVIRPAIAPLTSALFTGIAVCFIAWMFTTTFAYIATATAICAVLSGYLRFKSDSKQARVNEIVSYAKREHILASQGEQQLDHQLALSQIINEIVDPEDINYRAKLGKLYQHNIELKKNNDDLKQAYTTVLKNRPLQKAPSPTPHGMNPNTLFMQTGGVTEPAVHRREHAEPQRFGY